MTIEVEETVGTATQRPLPAGWRWSALGELVGPDGVFTDGDWVESKDQDPNGEIRLIQLADVGDGVYRNRSARFLTAAKAAELNCTYLASGDVLIARMPEPLGRACIFPGDPRPAVTVVDVCVLRTGKSEMCQEWLMYTINSPIVRAQMAGLQSGATRNRISRSNLSSIHLPIPSLPEQRRIAAILGEQMAAVERARAAAQAQLAAAKALPAAYLRAVFESDEAQAWPRVTLGEIAPVIQNGIYKPAEFYGHGHSFIRMYNIPNFHWQLDMARLALVEISETELETFSLRAGDLLISRVNSHELVGKCGIVEQVAEGCVFENMLIRVRLSWSANPLFVAQQLGTSRVREQIAAVAKRAIGQSSINSSDVKNLQLVMPPLADQARISAMLDTRIQSAQRAASLLSDQLDAIDHLPAALLRRAFNGEL